MCPCSHKKITHVGTVWKGTLVPLCNAGPLLSSCLLSLFRKYVSGSASLSEHNDKQ